MNNKILAPSLLVFWALGCSDSESDPPQQTETPSILEIAQSSSELSTLVSLIQSANLTSIFGGNDKITVFAPKNDAFEAVDVPDDADLRANILLHHMVRGTITSNDLSSAEALTTLAKTELRAQIDSTVTVGGAELSDKIDVRASDGIVHITNEILIPPTVLEATEGTEELSTLFTAVGASSQGVRNALASTTPITVFAPVNSAFSMIPTNELNDLLADQEALDSVLSYHVVAGQTLSTDLSEGQIITTAEGETISVVTIDGALGLQDKSGNNVRILEADIRLLNGTLHLIDRVLMPTETLPNIVELASAAGQFSTLLQAATSVGLDQTLANDGPFTVFAPNDTAFASVNLDNVSSDVVANVLLHHVVPGTFGSSQVVATSSLTTAANTSLGVDVSQNPIRIGGGQLSSTLDLQASNGIVHVMDSVILPPTILDVAGSTSDLSTLVTAVGAASLGVQSALDPNTMGQPNPEMPITVFAPLNSAFAQINPADLNALLANQAALDSVLSYHVVAGQVLSSDLEAGSSVVTLQGATIAIVQSNNSLALQDQTGQVVQIVGPDIRLQNGVVHLIDTVLLPN